jgi:predicted  nucleic acid-binding Zn-ribbon protein
MTEESVLLVKELKEKVHRIFGEYSKLEIRNEELHNEIISLQKRIAALENEKTLLGTKYDNLKLAKMMEPGYGDNQVARQKINKLLREIDKCVALLNG